MSRYYPKVSRDVDAIEREDKKPSWFDDFVSNLEKAGVKSKKEDYSLFNQINDILNKKSRYSSVEEAVLDMQKRTGLFDILQRKQASDNSEAKSLLEEVPVLKTFIENYLKANPGTSIAAVVRAALKVKEIHDKMPEKDDLPEDVKKYINQKLLEQKRDNVSSNATNDVDIGKADLNAEDGSASNDPFSGCMPARVGK